MVSRVMKGSYDHKVLGDSFGETTSHLPPLAMEIAYSPSGIV